MPLSYRVLATLTLVMFVSGTTRAATLWNGPPITFSKTAFSDPALAANQDRITANVWITRASTRGIYNIAPGAETFYAAFVSPTGTRWAVGSLAMGVENLTFSPWQSAVGSNPPGAVNQPMVLHLIEDDIYLDITLTSWAEMGPGGGAFSYVRSTPGPAVKAQVPMFPTWGLVVLGAFMVSLARRPLGTSGSKRI